MVFTCNFAYITDIIARNLKKKYVGFLRGI